MNPQQDIRIRNLQSKLGVSDGQLKGLTQELFPGLACCLRDRAELTQYQATKLIEALENIELETMVNA